MALVAVGGDVHDADAGVFEVTDEGGLFFWVEAEVAIDAEDEVVVVVGAGAFEEFGP